MNAVYPFQKKPTVFGNLEAHSGAVQGSCGEWLDRVPLPRCARWSADGLYTQEAVAEHRALSDLLRQSRRAMAAFEVDK